jgi:ATP-dependent RNA circularization protein (DNA/RNA ligase family)
MDLKETSDNTYWKIAREKELENIIGIMNQDGNHYALQGEVIGEGINGNMYKISGNQFRLFDIYNITESRYLNPTERMLMWTNVCRDGDMHVPVISSFFRMNESHTVDKLLEMVEHKSHLNKNVWAEGWVMRTNDGNITFKVISNKFLCTDYGDDS